MAIRMTSAQYINYINNVVPKSKTIRNLARAFFVGGLICCIGQAIGDGYGALGLSKENAALLTSVTLIFIGAVLTGFGVFDKIAKFAGAGTLVPITGFANSVVAPALDFKTEGLITGLAVKMFTIAGPVIVYGILASVVYGLVYWIIGLF